MAVLKLSDANPIHAFFLDISVIDKYVFCPETSGMEDRQYDYCLVLGCSVPEIMDERIKEAVRLKKDEKVGTLVLSGGVGFLSKYRKYNEAMYMHNYAINNGVSDSDIIVEDASRDTFENARNSLQIIDDPKDRNSGIVIVTSDFHRKRAEGIIRNMTSNLVCSHGVINEEYDRIEWQRSLMGQRMIRTEAFLLSLTVRRGLMEDQNVETLIRRKKY